MTPKETAKKWGISQRRVHTLCLEGKLLGAERHGWTWMIPETTEKPSDARVKSGRYIKLRQDLSEKQALPAVIDEMGTSFLIHSANDRDIPRPRLIEKISPPGSRLTYIHAAAGYGKTTLLIQYVKEHENAVWISIDDKDSDTLFFLQHLEFSIREKLVRFEFHATDYIPFVGSKTFISTVLSALLQAIGSSTLTIILDDVHEITNDMLTYLLTELANGCTPNLTLVMASRHEPWSGLFRLKMAGKVAELTKKDLCFSQEEAEKLWGFYDEAAYLATEGWTLAIQSYHIAAQGNREFSLSRLHADRDICRYLINEIFTRLPMEMQYFLKATSWIPDLEAMRCNGLLGIDNSQEILEELIRRNIFTLRISASSYRYHTLFRSFLQQNDEGLGWKTLYKAMICFYDSGDYEQAADYALLVEDRKIIHDCISAIAGRPFDGGRYGKLKKYLDFMETHPTELSPRVQLVKGIFLSNQGDFGEADKYLGAAMSQLNSDDKNLYLYAMTHKARVLRNRISFEESSRCIDSLLPLLEGVSMQGWYAVMIEKIHNLTLTSQLSAALELTLAMMEKCLVAGDLRIKSWFERYLTAIYFYIGDYKNCLKAYEKSLTIPQEEQDWLMRHCVGAYAAKAYQIAGQEDMVLPLLEAELERMHQLGLHEEFSINYLLYAEILNAMELLKFYLGKAADFSVSDRYLSMAEEYALLNRSTRHHAVFVNIWKLCATLLKQPEKTEEYIHEILILMEETTPFFQTLAYGRMANALEVLKHDRRQYKEYYKKSIKIGESVCSYGYAAIAYGKLAAIYLNEGDEGTAKEYTRKFMELSFQYDNRYYIRFKPLFARILKLAVEWDITPEFTREMLVYGGYPVERVYINTMGTLYIAPSNDKKNPVKIRTQKARELLAYLLEHRVGITREQILADLWWDSEANVTSLFHTRRGEIRRAFESMGAGNPILHEGDAYRLCMDEIICDYDDFKQAAFAFEQQPSFENAKKVVGQYTGRYLNDLEALWAESVRLRCEEIFLAAAEVLLESYAKSGERAKTMELLRWCTKLGHKV